MHEFSYKIILNYKDKNENDIECEYLISNNKIEALFKKSK